MGKCQSGIETLNTFAKPRYRLAFAWPALLAVWLLAGCAKPAESEDVLMAVGSGDSQKLAGVLSRGGSAKARDKRGYTAIAVACLNGNPEVVRLLLENGAEVTSRSPNQDPLTLAIQSGNVETVKLLLEKGANPDGDFVRQPPLGMATSTDVAAALIEAGADVNGSGGPQKDRPLGVAVRRGQVALARFLIEKGADVLGSNTRGQSPLHIACSSRSSELLTDGDDPTEALIRLLLEHGADPGQLDEVDNTSLHYLARNTLSTVGATEALLNAGASLTSKNRRGMTPLEVAGFVERAESDPVMKLLRKKGHNPLPKAPSAPLGSHPVHEGASPDVVVPRHIP